VPDLNAAREQTQAVYERRAMAWHRNRLRDLNERKWIDRFLQGLGPAGRLLDLGCGSGDPIGGYLLSLGHSLVGVDYSESMIALARKTYPAAEWHVQDMRCLDVAGPFDGILSWDGFFHLSPEEQRALLPWLAAMIRPGGALLMTVGPGEGAVTGSVEGEAVYHASLSPAEYTDTLSVLGFADILFAPEDPDVLGRSVLLAAGKRG
jgi:cyclopropane fatty-acyl-phospholipid synthase-like methyltransferase